MFDMTEEDVIEFIENFEPDDEFETSCSMKELIFQKELTLIKQVYQ